MAYRVDKVASVIREVVSDAISSRLSDPRISPFASVTRVEVSGDLQHANVYISVMGSPSDQNKTMAALGHASGRIQGLLARRFQARHCPRILFFADTSIKQGMETIRLIDQAMQELDEPEAADRSTVDDADSANPPESGA